MLGDLPVHRYGPASNAKWILWGHDIFGVLSGRTMEYCAKMNEDLGVTCILPDFFRGADPWVPGDPVPSTWAQMGIDWEEKLVPYLTEEEQFLWLWSGHALALTLEFIYMLVLLGKTS